MVLRFVVDVHTTEQKKVKKTKHAHMKMEINENATKTSTN
jgi:hypothetical protein